MSALAKSTASESAAALLLSAAGLLTTSQTHGVFDRLRAHALVKSVRLNPKSDVSLVDQVRSQLSDAKLKRVMREVLPSKAHSRLEMTAVWPLIIAVLIIVVLGLVGAAILIALERGTRDLRRDE